MKIAIENIKSFIKKRHIVPKLLSLIFASLLWVIIINQNIATIYYKIPIQIINKDDDLIISKIQKKYATVIAEGNKEDLKNINRNKIFTKINFKNVNLKNYVEGTPLKLPIDIIKPDIPENVKLFLKDTYIYLWIEKKTEKTVPIKHKYVINEQITGKYLLGNTQIIPDTAKITGGKTKIANIDFISTKAIQIKNLNSVINKNVRLELSTLNKGNIEVDIDEVKIIVPVYNANKVNLIQPEIIVKNLSDEYSAKIINNKINLYIKIIDKDTNITREDFKPFIDLASIDDKSFGDKTEIYKNMPVIIKRKNQKDYKIIDIVPNVITVKIKKK